MYERVNLKHLTNLNILKNIKRKKKKKYISKPLHILHVTLSLNII